MYNTRKKILEKLSAMMDERYEDYKKETCPIKKSRQDGWLSGVSLAMDYLQNAKEL